MARFKKSVIWLLAAVLCVCAALFACGLSVPREAEAADGAAVLADYTRLDVRLADDAGTLYTSLTANGLKAKLVVTAYAAEGEGVALSDDEYTLTVNGTDVTGDENARLFSGGGNSVVVAAGGASASLTVTAVANNVSEVAVAVSDALKEGSGNYAGLWVNAEGYPVFFTDMNASEIAAYLKVTVTYADGSSAVLSESDFLVTGLWNTAGESSLTIAYSYNNSSHSGTISLRFIERAIVAIRVAGGWQQGTIYSGTDLSDVWGVTELFTGLVIEGQYNDGGDWVTLEETQYTFSGDLHIAGTKAQEKEITVSYADDADVSDTFTVTVTPETPEDVGFRGNLTGTQHTYQPLNPSGITMTVEYPSSGSNGYKSVSLSDVDADHVTVEYYDEAQQRLLDTDREPIDYITFDVHYVKLVYTENGIPFTSDFITVREQTITASTIDQPGFDTTHGEYNPDPDKYAETTMTGFVESAMKIGYSVTDVGTGEPYEQSGLDCEIAGDTVTFTASMAGVYTITVTLTDRNYIWASSGSTPVGDTLTFVWTVNKIEAEPTVTIEGWAYGEDPNAPQVVLEGNEGATYTFKYMGTPNDGSGYTDFGQRPPTLAGEYTVMVEVDASRNYTGGSSSAYAFTISRATVSAPTLGSKTYTGGTLTADEPTDDRYTVTENAGGVDVGTYSVTLSLTDTNNYKWAEEADGVRDTTVSWQIVKAKVDAPSLAESSTVYTEAEQDNEIVGYIADRFEFSSDTATVRDNFVYATDAGTYTVTVGLADPHNYEWVGGGTADVTLTWTITPMLLTAPTLGEAEHGSTYTGSALTYTVNGFDDARMNSDASEGLAFADGILTATDAGAYTLTVTLQNTNNYNWDNGAGESAGTNPVELKWTIAVAENEIYDVTVSGFTFGGEFTQPTADARFGARRATFTYYYGGWDGSDYEQVDAPVNAGRYYVVATIAADPEGNYKEVKFGTADTTAFTVARAQIEKPAWESAATYTYNSHEQTRSLNDDFDAALMTVSAEGANGKTITDNKDGSFTATNADTYTITLSLGENAVNYEWSDGSGYSTDDFTLTWVINKATNTLTVTVGSIVYGGTPDPQAEAAYGDDVQYTYWFMRWDESEYTQLTPGEEAFDSGYYYVVAAIAGTDDYTYAEYGGEESTPFIIARAEADEPAIDGTYTYTGKEQTVVLSPAAGTAYTVTENGTQTNAGTYDVVVTLDYNYKWTGEEDTSARRTVTLEWTIEKQLVSAPALTYGEGNGRYIEYDEEAGVLQPTVARNDALYTVGTLPESSSYGTYPFTVTLLYPDNYAWDEKSFNAGANDGETARDAVSGTDGETLTMWYKITLTQYTFTATAEDRTYTGTASEPELQFSGIPEEVQEQIKSGNVKVTYRYYLVSEGEGTATTEKPVNAGDYAVIISIGEAQNHAPASYTAFFTISPVQMTGVDISDKEYTFDGQSYFARAIADRTANTVDGSVPVWTFSLVYDADGKGYEETLDKGELVNKGSYTVYYRVTEANHITATGRFTVEIGAMTVTLTWSEDNYTYDGTEQTVTAQYTAADGSSLVPLAVSITAGESAFLNAGDYTFTAAFAEGDNALGNYALPADVTEDYTMQQAAVTVTIDMAPQTYDGNTHTTIDAVRDTHYTVTDGTVYGEDNLGVTLTVNGGTGAKNVGTYSVSAAAENGNYAVTFAGETDAFVISPAQMTVSGITNQNYTFDGNSFFERATADKAATTVDGSTPVWTFSLKKNADGEGYTETLDGELLHAGSYTVHYRVTEPNHETATGSFTVDIAQRSVAAVWTDTAFTYDGTNQLTRVTAHYMNVYGGEVDLTVTLTGGGAFQDWREDGYNFTAAFDPETDTGYADYTLTKAAKNYTMQKRSVWVIAEDKSAAYGDETPAFTWAYTGDSDGNTAYQFLESTDGWFTLTTAAQLSDGGTHVTAGSGSYAINVQYTGSENYDVHVTAGTLTVSPRAITVTIDRATSVYGEAQAQLKATVSAKTPLYDGDTDADVFRLSSAVNTQTGVGSYAITLENVKGEDYYTIDSNAGDLLYTVTAAAITDVSVTPAEDLVYNASDRFAEAFERKATTVNGQAQTWLFSITYNADGETGYTSALDMTAAGTYTVYYSVSAPNHTIYVSAEAEPFTVVIEKASVARPAWSEGGESSLSTTYGDMTEHAVYNWSAQLESEVTATGGSACSAEGGTVHAKAADSYTVTISISYTDNYKWEGAADEDEAQPVELTWTIGKAALTVTVTGGTVYGEPAPADEEYTVTAKGLQFGESAKDAGVIAGDAFTIAHIYVQGSGAGSYALTLTEKHGLANYTVTYVSEESVLTVAERAITLIIDDVSVDYGVTGTLTLRLDEGTFYDHTASDFVEYLAVYADTEGKEPVTVNNELPAGTYYIIGRDTNKGIAANYAITFVGESRGYDYGVYLVGVADIFIDYVLKGDLVYDGTAKTVTATTETPNVTFSYTYQRQNADGGWEDLGEGEYPVDAGTYRVLVESNNPNYSVNASQSTISIPIAKATFTVSVSYNTSYTYIYSGNANKPAVERLDEQTEGLDGTKLVIDYDDGIVNVTEGTTFYARLSLSDDTNYKLETKQLSTIVVVNPYVIESAVWTENSFIYDGTDRFDELSATAEGAEGLDDSFDLVIAVQEFRNAGEYTFTASLPDTEAAKNYVLSDAAGAGSKTYTMQRRTVTIKADDASLVYGEQPSGLTGNYAGDSASDPLLQFVGSDGITILVRTDATNTSGVGTYRTYIDALEEGVEGALKNYTVNTVNGEEFAGYAGGASGYDGVMRVTARPVSVAIATPDGEEYSGEYRKATATAGAVGDDPASGVVNGDVLTFAYTYTWDGGSGTDGAFDQGEYTVTVQIDNNNNYEIAEGYGTATFTILPKEVQAVWDEEQTFTYTGVDQATAAGALAYFEGVGADSGRGQIALTTTTEGTFCDVGSYTFTAAFAAGSNEAGNYTLDPSTTTHGYSIGKADLVWSEEFAWQDEGNVKGYSWIYGDTDLDSNRTAPVAALANNAEYLIKEGAGVSVAYYSDENYTHPVESFSSETPAGNYWAVVTAAGTDNYNELTKTYPFTVEQLAVSVHWESGSLTYDGNLKTNTLVFETAYMKVSHGSDPSSYQIVISGDTVTMTATNVDTYSVTVTLTSDNYKWSAYDGHETEGKRDLTVSWRISNVENYWVTELRITGWTYGQYNEALNMPVAQAAYGTVVFYYTAAGAGEPGPGSFSGLTQLVPTNAGTYYVVAYVEATEDYGMLWATASFEVKKAGIAAPTALEKSYTYSGDSITFLFKEGTFDDALMYISGNVQVNANESGYTVTVTLRDTNNYKWDDDGAAEREYLFVIAKQPVAAPTLPSEEWVYDGTAQHLTLAGFSSTTMGVDSMEGLTLEVSGTTSVTFGAVNAGSYTIVISLKDTSNYTWASGGEETVTLVWEIAKAENEWQTELTADGWTYGETPSLPSAAALHGEAEYRYYTLDGEEYTPTETPTALTAAGTYYVQASVAETQNYGALVSDYVAFTVEKADYDLSSVRYTGTEAVYDGDPHAPTAVGLPVGLDDVRVTAQIETAVDAGIHTLAVTFTGSDNYNTPEPAEVELTITARETAVVWENTAFTYDGSDQSGKVTAYYEKVDGEPVYLTVTLTGADEDGFKHYSEEGYTFTAAFAEGDEVAKNYTLTGEETLLYMGKAAVTAALLPQSATYSGEDLSSALQSGSGFYEVTGGTVYPGDDLGVTVFVVTGEAVGAGAYAIGGSATNTNYDVTFVQGVFTVEQREVTVAIDAGGGTYGGQITSATAQLSGGVAGDDLRVVLTYTGTANSGTDVNGTECPSLAGTYTVTASLAGGAAANYVLVGTHAATVIVARAYVSVPEIASKEYTGRALTADIAKNDLYTAEQGADWVNAGSYTVTLTLTDANNYRWEGASGATYEAAFVIERAQNSVTAPEVEETYTYDDAIVPSGAKAEFGTVYYVYATREDSPDYSPTVPTQAGTYYVRAAVAATVNYYGATSSEAVAFTILPREVARPALRTDSSVYSGGELTNLLTGYVSSFMSVNVGSLRAAQTQDGLELYASEAGEYSITVTITDPNYAWKGGGAEYTLTWKITALTENTVTVTVGEGMVYGGTLDVQVSAAAGEAVLTYYADENGSMGAALSGVPTDAGTYWVIASVAATENYAGGQSVPVQFTISPVTVAAPSLTGDDATYSGAVQTNGISGLDLTLMEVSSEAQIVLSGASFSLEATQAGAYTVTFTLNDDVNYVFETGDGTLTLTWTIAPQTVAKPTAAEGSFTADGSVLVYMPVGFDAALMTIAGNEQSEAGEYTVTVSLVDPVNYVWADGSADPVTFAFTVGEAEGDYVWLIAVLGAAFAGETAGLIAELVKRKKKPVPDGGPDGDAPEGDDPNGGGNDPDGGEGGTPEEGAAEGEAAGNSDDGAAPAEEGEAPSEAETPAEEGETPSEAEPSAEEGKEEPSDGGKEEAPAHTDAAGGMFGMAALGAGNLLAAGLGGQEWACVALGAACLVLGIADIVLLVKRRKKAKAARLQELAPAEEPAAEQIAEEPAAEEPAAEEPAAEEALIEAPAPEEAPEPAEERPAEAEQPEEAEEEGAEGDEGETDEENVSEEDARRLAELAGIKGGQAWFRYNYSFLAKLALASEEVRSRYAALYEEITRRQKVKTRVSWRQERVRSGRKNLAMLFFRGRRLCIALALDPAEFAETKYRGEDVSGVKRFAATPMMLRISSPRKLKYAMYLFGLAAERAGLTCGESGQSAELIPPASVSELIAAELIRVTMNGGGEAVDVSQLLREKLEAGAAQQALPEEAAVTAEEAPAEAPAPEEAPEPAEEQPAEEQPEEAEEEGAEGDEGETDEENVSEEDARRLAELAGIKGGQAWFRYNYSFLAKLALASEEVRSRYAALYEEITRRQKVKTRVSWRQERVRSGRKNLAMLFFRGRRLCIALALDPAEFAETKYRGEDVSGVKRFAATPMMLRISSPRKLKYAMYLFGLAAERAGLICGESGQSAELIPPASVNDLIAAGLIRVTMGGRNEDGSEAETVDISQLIRDKITLDEAHSALTDEAAATLVESAPEPAEPARQAEKRAPAGAGKRAIVNIDTLSLRFAAGETVTLGALKKRGLAPQKAGSLKVLARGMLDKPLTVEADDFSPDAVKMIVLTGGKAARRSAVRTKSVPRKNLFHETFTYPCLFCRRML